MQGGQQIGALVASHLVSDGDNVEPKFAKINANNSGDMTIVSAVSGKRIKLIAGFFVAAADVTVAFKSGSTALTGDMAIAAHSGIVWPLNEVGYLVTAVNQALIINLGSGVQVGGGITYIEVN